MHIDFYVRLGSWEKVWLCGQSKLDADGFGVDPLTVVCWTLGTWFAIGLAVE